MKKWFIHNKLMLLSGGGLNSTSKPLVIIPAFNEAAVIEKTLLELANYKDFDYLVVDDGSTDNTKEILKSLNIKYLALPFNLGVGVAMRAGFKYALANGYQAAVQFDADLQHKPEFISQLVSELNKFDVVVGSRFINQNEYKVSRMRAIAMKLLRIAVSRHTGAVLTDVTSGFRSAGPKAISLFAEHYPSEYLADTVESLMLAADHNLKIAEIPVSMQPRQGGQPSQNLIRSAFYLGRSVLVLIASLGIRKG